MTTLVVLSNIEHQCITFIWPDDLRYYVGYRLVEHLPITTAHPLPHQSTLQTQSPPVSAGRLPYSKNWLDNWLTHYAETKDSSNLYFHALEDGSAEARIVDNLGLQEWSWRFVPEEAGVRLWMTLTTHEAIPGAYIVQQCLRFSSGIGTDFRSGVARTPFLSELLMQVLGNANGTITWARRDEEWQAFPVPFTRYHVTAGAGVHDDSSGQIDCGLIVRESASRTLAPESYWQSVAPDAKWVSWSAGLFWERTVAVSNRHPADCLHACVDFGPLKAGESRTLQGKFYWLEGTKDDLYALWQEEFGIGGETRK